MATLGDWGPYAHLFSMTDWTFSPLSYSVTFILTSRVFLPGVLPGSSLGP